HGAPAHDAAVDLVARERDVDLVAARVIERRAGGRVLLVIEMGERAGRAPRDELVQLALRPAPTRLSVRITPLAPPRATALTAPTAPSIARSGVRFLDQCAASESPVIQSTSAVGVESRFERDKAFPNARASVRTSFGVSSARGSASM